MKKQRYEVIGETAYELVTVITTARTRDGQIAALLKKYPTAQVLDIVELAMYK